MIDIKQVATILARNRLRDAFHVLKAHGLNDDDTWELLLFNLASMRLNHPREIGYQNPLTGEHEVTK